MNDTLIVKCVEFVSDTLFLCPDQISQTAQNEHSQLISNGIIILLALIAGFITLFQVKSNTISSSRIKWIELLKKAVSNYCVCIDETRLIIHEMRYKAAKLKEKSEISEMMENYYPEYVAKSSKSTQLGIMIKLNLNSNENNHKKIEELIDGLEKELQGKKTIEIDDKKIENDLNKIVILSKRIFKEEWDRSKRIYRI